MATERIWHQKTTLCSKPNNATGVSTSTRISLSCRETASRAPCLSRTMTHSLAERSTLKVRHNNTEARTDTHLNKNHLAFLRAATSRPDSLTQSESNLCSSSQPLKLLRSRSCDIAVIIPGTLPAKKHKKNCGLYRCQDPGVSRGRFPVVLSKAGNERTSQAWSSRLEALLSTAYEHSKQFLAILRSSDYRNLEYQHHALCLQTSPALQTLAGTVEEEKRTSTVCAQQFKLLTERNIVQTKRCGWIDQRSPASCIDRSRARVCVLDRSRVISRVLSRKRSKLIKAGS